MKKSLCIVLLGIVLLSLTGCGKKEEPKDTQKPGNQAPLELEDKTKGVEDIKKEEDIKEVKVDSDEAKMTDKELFSSIQIGSTVVEMPITYDKLANVDQLQMFTDPAREINATENFLVEAGDEKEIYCKIADTSFTVTFRNQKDAEAELKDCEVYCFERIRGADVIFPGNIQATKTDLLTLKEVWGKEVTHERSVHTYYGNTYSQRSADNEYIKSITDILLLVSAYWHVT